MTGFERANSFLRCDLWHEKGFKAWNGFEMLSWYSVSYLKPSSRRSWPYVFHDWISPLYPDDKLKRSLELLYNSKFNNRQSYCYNRGRSKAQLEYWSIETNNIQKLKNYFCLAMEIGKAIVSKLIVNSPTGAYYTNIVAIFWQPTDKFSVKRDSNSC